MQVPDYTPEEALTRQTFLAMMWALSHPGRIQTLEAAAPFVAIATTLLDLETSYFTPDEALKAELARTGARALEPERAAYHFYPELTAWDSLEKASPGTMLYPDTAATLVIGCKLGAGNTFTLSGPGIQTTQPAQIQVDERLWTLRQRVSRYPLGWDIFFVDGNQLLGLPRTTQIKG